MSEALSPKISLLVPIYNVEDYLEECLRSAQRQTFSDFEVICINDGSTDGSLAIISSFVESDERFKLLDKENSGYGASMNRGIQAAIGEYIGILESDDFIEPQTLETLYNLAVERDAEVVKANFYYYWSTPQKKDVFEPLMRRPLMGVSNPKENTEIFYLKPTIWSALYRRDFLINNKVAFLETPGASYQDAGFNFKVWASAKKVAFIYDAFLHYRQDNESSSVNSPGKVYCVVDEYAEMQRFIDENPDERAWLQGTLIAMKFDSYIWNYDRLAEEFKQEFLSKASEELNSDLENGRMDITLFPPWKEADMRLLLQSPDAYDSYRKKYSTSGKLNTFKRYFYLGGLGLVGKLAAHRLFKAK